MRSIWLRAVAIIGLLAVWAGLLRIAYPAPSGNPLAPPTPTPTKTPTPTPTPIPPLEAFSPSSWVNQNLVASTTPTIPSTWHAGDCLILICKTGQFNNTFLTPSGWTSIYNQPTNNTFPSWGIFTKTAVAGDLGSTVTCACGACSTANQSGIVLGVTSWDTTAACVTAYGPNSIPSGSTKVITPTTADASPAGRAAAADISIWLAASNSGPWSAQTNANFGAMKDYNQDLYVDVAIVKQTTASTSGVSSSTLTTADTYGAIALVINAPAPTPTPTPLPSVHGGMLVE